MKLAEIAALVARTYGLSVTDLRERTKRAAVVHPRHAYCELARRYTPHSCRIIGVPLGLTPHQVTRGWRRFAVHMCDADFAARFGRLDAALSATHPLQPERLKTRPKPWLKKPPPPDVLRETRVILGSFHAQKREIERIEKAYANG